jgi:hypothetical protein
MVLMDPVSSMHMLRTTTLSRISAAAAAAQLCVAPTARMRGPAEGWAAAAVDLRRREANCDRFLNGLETTREVSQLN